MLGCPEDAVLHLHTACRRRIIELHASYFSRQWRCSESTISLVVSNIRYAFDSPKSIGSIVILQVSFQSRNYIEKKNGI